MDVWEKFNETSLPKKEDFCSHLKMEDITDADYVHANEFLKILKYKIKVNVIICMFKAVYDC